MGAQTALFRHLSADPDTALRDGHALLARIKSLKEIVVRGGYDQHELGELKSLIRLTPSQFFVGLTEIEKRAGLSKGYLRLLLSTSNTPKLHTFLRLLDALDDIAISFLNEEKRLFLSWQSNPIYLDKARISSLEEELGAFIEHLKKSNSFHHVQEIDEIFRKNLINHLETLLAILKAPMVELSLIRKTIKLLGRISGKTGESLATGGASHLADELASQISEHLLG
jgi:transcriptional regulator with XRE-family HTH domain